jgi:hypothetical protein
METWTWRHGDSKRKKEMEAQAIFLNPFFACSSWKRKLVVCPFVEAETNESYPFANRLNRINGINGLVHLWLFISVTVHCPFN